MKCLVCGAAKDPESLTCLSCGESSWDMTDEAPKKRAGRKPAKQPEPEALPAAEEKPQ